VQVITPYASCLYNAFNCAATYSDDGLVTRWSDFILNLQKSLETYHAETVLLLFHLPAKRSTNVKFYCMKNQFPLILGDYSMQATACRQSYTVKVADTCTGNDCNKECPNVGDLRQSPGGVRALKPKPFYEATQLRILPGI
jgi:hypothetical protein